MAAVEVDFTNWLIGVVVTLGGTIWSIGSWFANQFDSLIKAHRIERESLLVKHAEERAEIIKDFKETLISFNLTLSNLIAKNDIHNSEMQRQLTTIHTQQATILSHYREGIAHVKHGS